MKKNYFALKAFIVLLSLFALPAAAALSGVYTINSGQVTGSTNYQTFTAFANDLNTLGVSGAVTVNVVAGTGPYNEQIVFNAAAGMSSTNKVTIDGNNNLITFNASSGAPWTISLNSADWMVIKNLRVEGTNATYAFPLILSGGADNNMFTNCTFSCNANQGTGTNQIPVVISGSNTFYSGTSNSGSNNTWDGCEMFGGYFGFSTYGPTSVGTYNFGNKVLNCWIHDFYYYGLYLYYHDRLTISGNTIDRATRTNLPTGGYGIYSYPPTGTIIEKNKIRKFYEQQQTSTGSVYGIYIQGNSVIGAGDPNYIRNNIISDMKCNGTIYGMYIYYLGGDISHNTLVFDHTASTGGSAYGLFLAGTTGFLTHSRDNIVYITKGGSGSKYGMYYNGTGFATADYNDYYINGAGGNNFAGYYNANQTTLANLQTSSTWDTHSYTLDPQFANAAGGDFTPTNASLNNKGIPMGVVFDHNNMVRNATTPDLGAIEFLTPSCTGAPGSNTVNAPTYSICSGENVTMGLVNLLSDAGLTYQWQKGTQSNVGPWTPIAGANGLFYTANGVTANTYYNVIVTCTLAGGQSSNYTGYVMVSGPTQSTIPYYEGFEGIGMPNRLPNCSWSTSSQGTSNLTALTPNSGNRVPHNGSGYASFANTSPGTTYYYTNPIQMNTGITYSAALWYASEYFGYNNWTNLSIMVGPNQNPTGMVTVASVGPAISGNYKLLDNTFTVPSNGLYYVAIKATSINGSAMYLSWDDLSITIPCGPTSPNSPTLTTSLNQGTVCAGTAVSVFAGGADTYTWSTGMQGGSMTDFPTVNTTYTVTGENTATGCKVSATEMVVVTPSPIIYIVASSPAVCSGKPVVLTALGAATYAWSNAMAGSNITINPTTSTMLQVIGTNNFNCTGSQSISINVYTNPPVTINPSSTQVCLGDNLTLTGNGALTYQWQAGNTLMVGNPLILAASGTGTYAVTGTDANGCTNSAVTNIVIEPCVGLTSYNANMFRVYPNPTTGDFTVEMGSGDKMISVTDVTGRIVYSGTTNDASFDVNISQLAGGVYYVKVSTGSTAEVIKVVKQ